MTAGELVREAGVSLLTASGRLGKLQAARAPMCRVRLDRPEWRTHLVGSLGRALFTWIEAEGWAKRREESRVVRFSSAGLQAFDATFPRGG